MSKSDELRYLLAQFEQDKRLDKIANERFKRFVREVEYQNDVFDELFDFINKRDVLKRYMRELNTKIDGSKDVFLLRTRDILEGLLASYSTLAVDFHKYYHEAIKKEAELTEFSCKLTQELLDLKKLKTK
jgi:hypothetical protein